MTEVISVKFKETGKAYYFDPENTLYKCGQKVIVDTARGIEFGEVVSENTKVPDESVIQPLRKVVRLATSDDIRQGNENHRKEKEAFDICDKKIIERGLDMKLVDVEYSFDRSKILFYFTSEGRVDFRELVKDLASHFHTRIELRQIGVRDEAKMLGGLGICGQPLCCSRFLNDFHPVSIKMAKEQGLSLNPTKISGNCGRLMCCLNYEQNCYEALSKTTPHIGALVSTPQGVGTVLSASILEQICKVRIDGDDTIITFDCPDVTVLKGDKKIAAMKKENNTEPKKTK